jgi:type I restriction enzyme S subunit
MNSEWALTKLSILGKFDRGKSKHRPRDAKHMYGGPYPFIQTGDITAADGRIINYRQTYSEAGLAQSRLWPQGTLCITIAANIAETALLTFSACFPDSVVGFTPYANKADVRFIEYVFRAFRENVKSRAYGSVQENINLEVLRDLAFPIPDLKTQVEIADFLSLFDDRIFLLRETNVTLEAIAQALFKSWFVDFDPVLAKAEGRQPEGIDAETAALFPDSFEKSELSLVPKGWKIFRIADVVDIIKGKSYSSKDLVNEFATALVTLKSFARGGGFRLDGFKPYSGSYKPTQIVVPGDLIIAYTDVTQAAELIGKPAIVVGLQEFDTLVASLDVGIIRPKVESISKQFLYGLFKTGVFQSHTLAHTSGTTVLHLSKDAVGSFVFVCPDRKIMDVFTTITEVITTQNQVSIDKIRTLTSLRDTLLPRLISGQLRLPEAEEIIRTRS